MKINNTSIPGFYTYVPGIELERGDFVIYDNSIYICTPKTGSSIIVPSDGSFDTNNFTTYLGNDTTSWEEFESLLNGQETSITDKLITSSVLSKILRRLLFGIDSTGIINEHLILSTNTISPGIKEFINESKVINAVDTLMESTAPEANNLCIKVSRDLFKELPDISNLELSNEKNFVILKHYTYNDTTTPDSTVKIRIQEVIDHINGICMYRYKKFLNISPSSPTVEDLDEGSREISSWKLSCTKEDYLSKLDSVLKYLKDNDNSLKTSEKFNFRSINIPDPQISDNKKIYSIVEEPIENLKTTTITISTSTKSSNLWKNYSMTVDLSDTEISYEFLNGVVLNSNSLGGNSQIILTIPADLGETKITSIYVRNYEGK